MGSYVACRHGCGRTFERARSRQGHEGHCTAKKPGLLGHQQAAVDDYVAEMPTKQLVEKYGVTIQTILNWVRQAGLPRRPPLASALARGHRKAASEKPARPKRAWEEELVGRDPMYAEMKPVDELVEVKVSVSERVHRGVWLLKRARRCNVSAVVQDALDRYFERLEAEKHG